MIVKNRERAMRTKVVDRLREVISTADYATLHRKDFARTMNVGHNTVDNWKRERSLIVIE
jgi:DNA-binding transcriptional regulator YiaG